MADNRIDISKTFQWRLPPEDAKPKVVPHYPDADDEEDCGLPAPLVAFISALVIIGGVFALILIFAK